MLVNLVPEFLACLAAPDPVAAYHAYLERHAPVLASYWHNYVLDLESPHAERVIRETVRAERSGPAPAAGGRGGRAHRRGSPDAGRATSSRRTARSICTSWSGSVRRTRGSWWWTAVAWRSCAWSISPGRANPQTNGLGLAPHLLPLWIAHEVAHAVRYTSPTSRAELRRLVAEGEGTYDYWTTGSRATLRELLVNEGVAVAASQAVAPGFEPWEYLGYGRRQYRRIRELDAFLRRAAAPELDRRGLGLRLRFLSGGMSPASRLVGGKVLPERSGYYLGLRMVESHVTEHGIAASVRAPLRRSSRRRTARAASRPHDAARTPRAGAAAQLHPARDSGGAGGPRAGRRQPGEVHDSRGVGAGAGTSRVAGGRGVAGRDGTAAAVE